MTQMSDDAWLLHELDDLKTMTADTLPNGTLRFKADTTDQACAKAEQDGIALSNPYFP